MEIRPVKSTEEISKLKALFQEYERYLQTDLCFQNFNEELSGLPKPYIAPSGAAWLLWEENNAVGCVAIKATSEKTGEMKRLFIYPANQGKGWGKKLVEKVIEFARNAGYEELRLDVLPKSTAAIALYKSIGFKAAEPYKNSAVQVQYFALKL